MGSAWVGVNWSCDVGPWGRWCGINCKGWVVQQDGGNGIRGKMLDLDSGLWMMQCRGGGWELVQGLLLQVLVCELVMK